MSVAYPTLRYNIVTGKKFYWVGTYNDMSCYYIPDPIVREYIEEQPTGVWQKINDIDYEIMPMANCYTFDKQFEAWMMLKFG